VLRQAWELDDADKAEKLIRNLARRVDQQWPGVAASILEGLDEILTVVRLKLPKELRRSLACTNIAENMMGTIRRVTRNVKRWRDAGMALRWIAAGMIEASFRRLKAHKQLSVPFAAKQGGGLMPAERAPMRKVREVLRLRHALGVSERQIAVTVGVSRSTVGEYLRRAAVIGITWPVPEGMDDGDLERRLFTPRAFEEKPARPLPDWTAVHRELKRRGVTLLLLWKEYRAEHADGYGYSRFYDLYREWCETISPTMRQAHGLGEKLFVDFAGDTVPVFDAATGVQRLAHVFVAALGASNFERRGFHYAVKHS